MCIRDRCDPEQLVVGAGLEYLLGLLAPLLPGPAAVETPGYPRARQVLENNGVPCRCLPVDADGLSMTALSDSDAAVCYVTPSHQFPTGVTMPAGSRAELLHWAARAPGQRYIIEDDYDSEFRFDTRPLPSLQGMAGADGPVVYPVSYTHLQPQPYLCGAGGSFHPDAQRAVRSDRTGTCAGGQRRSRNFAGQRKAPCISGRRAVPAGLAAAGRPGG